MTVAAITAIFALAGVLVTVAVNQFRRSLAAVERYEKLPCRVRRRQGSGLDTRESLSETIHSFQQDLHFVGSLLGSRLHPGRPEHELSKVDSEPEQGIGDLESTAC